MQNKQTNAQEAHRPALSSPSEVITMLNRTEQTWKQRARHDKTKHTVVKYINPNKLIHIPIGDKDVVLVLSSRNRC